MRRKKNKDDYMYDVFFEEEKEPAYNYKKRAKSYRSLEIAYKVVIIVVIMLLAVTFLPSRVTQISEPAVGSNVLIKGDPEATPVPNDEQTPSEAWRANISQTPIEDKLYVVWDDTRLSMTELPVGVNVLAPCWFKLVPTDSGAIDYVKSDVSTDAYSYVKMCHDGNVDVWGTVQCFKPDLSASIMTDASVRQQLIGQIVSWTEVYDLDGINIDFEDMNPEHKELFTQFCKEVKDAMPEGKPVSVDVTVKLIPQDPDNWYQSYDRGELAKVLDYVAVMTYDEHRSSSMKPVASIPWVDFHIRRLLEEVPSEKLLLGIPFHGTDYRAQVVDAQTLTLNPLWKSRGITTTVFQLNELLTNGSYQDTYGDGKSTTITLSYWIEKGSWNADLGITTYSFVDTNGKQHTIWIDDENSVNQKTTLAEDYNLAGVAVWKRTLGTQSMFNAIYEALE